jgi:hypothetical protein
VHVGLGEASLHGVDVALERLVPVAVAFSPETSA